LFYPSIINCSILEGFFTPIKMMKPSKAATKGKSAKLPLKQARSVPKSTDVAIKPQPLPASTSNIRPSEIRFDFENDIIFRSPGTIGFKHPYKFEAFNWIEVPRRGLFFTGGEYLYCSAFFLDVYKEWAKTNKPNTIDVRSDHYGTAYHRGYVYLTGGEYSTHLIEKCERFNLAAGKWERISALPSAAPYYSSFALDTGLVSIGSDGKGQITCIAKHDYESLECKELRIRLPSSTFPGICLATFQALGDNTQLYFLFNNQLANLKLDSPGRLNHIKPMPKRTEVSTSPCFYFDGSLYETSWGGYTKVLFSFALS